MLTLTFEGASVERDGAGGWGCCWGWILVEVASRLSAFAMDAAKKAFDA